MTSITFDTLNASKRLREAGMDERVAEAVVELVQQTSHMPDLSHLATKDDLRNLATKDELRNLATKDELRNLATKEELRTLATREELQATNADVKALGHQLRSEMAQLEARLSEKLRQQGWALIGGVAVLMTISTALIKLVP